MKQVYPVTIQSGMSQTGSYLLMLHEPLEGRQIPIIIGHSEAQCILLAQHPDESSKIRRPMTHQLMVEMMKTYGLTLRQVTIDRMIEGIFYATMHMSDGFNEHRLDSRTTDAITLALLTGAPIYADEKIIDECGVRTETPAAEKADADLPELQRLEEELRRCVDNEDYERAAVIQARIISLQNSK